MQVDRLISLHLPKTGGTSLAKQFEVALPSEIGLDYDHDPFTEAGRGTAGFPEGKRVVHGHFRPHRYAGAEAFRATFLRDPVENLISIYCFWLTFPSSGHPVHDRFLQEQPDILSFARYSAFSALMSETFFGDFDMRRFDFIGFHETREKDIPLLGQLIGLPLLSDVHENLTPVTAQRDALQADAGVKRRLRDLLIGDVKFYEGVRYKR